MPVSTLKILKDFSFLIVEDDDIARVLIKQSLKPYSKIIYEAKDGLEGLEKFKKNQVDFIITDIHMPNLNGFDMIKEIHGLKPGQFFIIMTSYDTDQNILNSIEEGALNFLRKPIDIKDLQTAVIMGVSKINNNRKQKISNNISIDIVKEVIYVNNEPIFLTHKNHKIFWLLYYNLDNLVSYEMFENYIYENATINKNTLHSAILRIKKELKEIKIQNIQNSGYILRSFQRPEASEF